MTVCVCTILRTLCFTFGSNNDEIANDICSGKPKHAIHTATVAVECFQRCSTDCNCTVFLDSNNIYVRATLMCTIIRIMSNVE